MNQLLQCKILQILYHHTLYLLNALKVASTLHFNFQCSCFIPPSGWYFQQNKQILLNTQITLQMKLFIIVLCYIYSVLYTIQCLPSMNNGTALIKMYGKLADSRILSLNLYYIHFNKQAMLTMTYTYLHIVLPLTG